MGSGINLEGVGGDGGGLEGVGGVLIVSWSRGGSMKMTACHVPLTNLKYIYIVQVGSEEKIIKSDQFRFHNSYSRSS